jgi:hypothetical protein
VSDLMPPPAAALEVPTVNPNAYAPVAMTLKEQKELVATIKEWKNKIKTGRTKLENQWNLNLAFYAGKQNVIPIPGVGGMSRLTVGKAPYWRSRRVFNHIRPLMRTELSKMTSQKPTAIVVPNSQDDEDVFAAEAAQAVYEGIYQGKKLDREIRRAVFWSVITGTGFLKVLWDPMAVDVVSDQMGDLKVTPEMPYNVYVPDFRCETLEEQPYLIHAQNFPVEKVRAMLSNVQGFDPSKIIADTKSTDDPLSTVWLEMEGKTEFEDTVEVLEVWIKPGTDRRWPNGAMLTIASDQLIQYVEGWPYVHGMYPFAKISGIPNGKFYADSTIVDLIPIQQEYNRTRNQIIEAKNSMAKPQLIAAQGSVDASKITTEPGQVITYKPGLPPPQPLPLQPLPSYVMDEVERLYRDFEDISGQHEISKGSPPAGVTAATAISFLSEQDDAKLTPQVRELETAIETIGHQILCLVSQFWETPRVVKQVGADSSFNAAVFKGADIKGNTDVRVEAGSALANSKAARQAFLMDMMKMGFLPVDIGLELLEMGNVASLYERIKIDERQAQRENLRMSTLDEKAALQYIDQRAAWEQMGGADPATGETIMPPKPPYPVNSFDDHGKHIDTHNRFRKSQAYEQLPPALKSVIDEHVNAHVAALMQMMPETQAGSTQPMPDTPTEQMQSGASAYAGPEDDSVTGSQQPPSSG